MPRLFHDRNIVVETDRLIMCRWDERDLGSLHAILSDPITMEHWPKPLTSEETKSWLARALERGGELPGRLAVHLRATGELIGDAGLTEIEVNDRPENDLGYIVHHPWWRRGFGTEAASGLLAYGHHGLRLKRSVASMAEDNVASWKVAEAIGMLFEDRLTNARNVDKVTRLYVSYA